MVTSLALCFDAPMQSWGTRSRGVIRDTTSEPTKSGVVGLLAAALGISREDDDAIAELARLRLAVRVDREGILERDYHTIQNVPTTKGTGHRTVVSQRYYLADALFLVVLQGDEDLLSRIASVVDRPYWPVYFGRRAFVPARPLLPPNGQPVAAEAEEILGSHPWLETSKSLRDSEIAKSERVGLRTAIDCPPRTTHAEVRHDHPLSLADGRRRFTTRTVLVDQLPLTDSMITTGDTPCS
ncbi:type I-E CRISPR-associated protein Cas5/CasD [Lentzea sp. DG1S-22]|uniref:type I-E CRISPR-associated protein Cas5/CasD n=1 Tax=Lentzea sp. DG1S-22 TaxID=3108822 RepID=UPI002E78594C|nr:type I-E CRISPR-associated protein Cas5/CasD [Lentzea sp. DG1S-22]WVH82760.1 type I-E CRISPR-associated protein Cas5/CasD [Lentzea sp. DG1S-22]